ncbi:MAG: pyridoxal phosphate-dependent aminotransferase family protein [Bacteroidales bacterium]|nr:pyridoxal phosphate-dependent aminotransferase family protein [Bacteroidales bacterium]MCR5713932.1 pyridoxal phosphate-dependent aminotransferase family protein [Bacteroidales bacterium]
MDIFERIQQGEGPLGQYRKDAHGYFAFPKLEGEIAPYMMFRGKRVLTWSLNNYLGLANHPEVRKADAEGAAKWGLAYPMGARMMSGHTSLHEKLERVLADMEKKEDAYLLNFGYQGMISILDNLVGRHDVIVYDSEDHACIMDGMRLHVGKRFVYQHNDMASLEKSLIRATRLTEETGGGILVITEGVFGMAGDLGALDKIVEFKKKYNFRLMIDDAHGFGTMGPTGAGTSEHFGVMDDVDVYFATFAKSGAGIGAFVASKEFLINYLRYNMRSQIFAKSLPMPMVEGLLKRVELIQTHPEFREQLWTVARALQSGFKKLGLDCGPGGSPVTPVYVKGTVPEATNAVLDLRENYGIFCSVVVYPVVPKDVIMFRIIPTAVHTLADVEKTLAAFAEIKEKMSQGKYVSDRVHMV